MVPSNLRLLLDSDDDAVNQLIFAAYLPLLEMFVVPKGAAFAGVYVSGPISFRAQVGLKRLGTALLGRAVQSTKGCHCFRQSQRVCYCLPQQTTLMLDAIRRHSNADILSALLRPPPQRPLRCCASPASPSRAGGC